MYHAASCSSESVESGQSEDTNRIRSANLESGRIVEVTADRDMEVLARTVTRQPLATVPTR